MGYTEVRFSEVSPMGMASSTWKLGSNIEENLKMEKGPDMDSYLSKKVTNSKNTVRASEKMTSSLMESIKTRRESIMASLFWRKNLVMEFK